LPVRSSCTDRRPLGFQGLKCGPGRSAPIPSSSRSGTRSVRWAREERAGDGCQRRGRRSGARVPVGSRIDDRPGDIPDGRSVAWNWSVVKEFMSATMTVGAHRSPHQMAHNRRKFEKIRSAAKVPGRRPPTPDDYEVPAQGLTNLAVRVRNAGADLALRTHADGAPRRRSRRHGSSGAHNSVCEPSQTSRGCIGVEEAFAELAVPHSAGTTPTPFGARREDLVRNPVGGPVRPFGWFHTVASRQTSLRNTASTPETAGTPAPGSAFMSSLDLRPPLMLAPAWAIGFQRLMTDQAGREAPHRHQSQGEQP